MAPRGRSRATQRGIPKKGERRIDAALDALKPWGFSEDQILKTVDDLLQVYGDDGWPFLEEGYYKLVVDTILEEQEKETEKERENEQKRRLVEINLLICFHKLEELPHAITVNWGLK